LAIPRIVHSRTVVGQVSHGIGEWFVRIVIRVFFLMVDPAFAADDRQLANHIANASLPTERDIETAV